jgi:hypothetical protein
LLATGAKSRRHNAPEFTHNNKEPYMKNVSRGLVAVTAVLSCALAGEAGAQLAIAGGYEFSYGTGTASGDAFKNRKGAHSTLEVLFSTRFDGSATPWLMGIQAGYFAAENPSTECVPFPPLGCARPHPDLAYAGLLAAFEPHITPSTFVHAGAGAAFVQPSSAGGPTHAIFASARLGQEFGRRLAITVGGRYILVPDLRGYRSAVTSYSVGLRVR